MDKRYNEVERQVKGQVWTIVLEQISNLVERQVRGLVIPQIYEQATFHVRVREHVTWRMHTIAREIFGE